MLMTNAQHRSVIVMEPTPTSADIILRHRTGASSVPEHAIPLPQSRLTPTQLRVAIFYDSHHQVVHTRVLRFSCKQVSGAGEQIGYFVPFHEGRIVSAEVDGLTVAFKKVLVCETHFLNVVTQRPYLLLSAQAQWASEEVQ